MDKIGFDNPSVLPDSKPPPFAQRRLFNRIEIATILQAILFANAKCMGGMT